jgi:hypothetical protein
MKGLRGVELPDDVAKPVPAGAEVRKRLEALYRDPKGLRRLYGIARKIVRSSAAIRRRDVDAPVDQPLYTGALLEDLVFEAITRVLEGRRKWDLDKHPDAFVYFGGVIGSLWTHFCRREELNKQSTPEKDDFYDWRTRRPRTPLELLIEKEEEEEYELLRADFEAEFKPEDRALDFLALTQDEIYDPAKQAELLGITMGEIYRLRERVMRTLERFLEQRKRSGRRKTST